MRAFHGISTFGDLLENELNPFSVIRQSYSFPFITSGFDASGDGKILERAFQLL